MGKILIIGNYGNSNAVSDGQTIKTRIVTDLLETELGNNKILRVNTFGGVKKIFSIVYGILSKGLLSDKIIYLTDAKGILIIPFLVFIIKYLRLKQVKTAYVVVGGWIPHFLPKHKIVKFFIKRTDSIYAETNVMCNALKSLGLAQTKVLPNCKNLAIKKENELFFSENRPHKLVTFSRVMREKGIEDAISVVSEINKRYGEIVYTLDIYGMVDPKQIEWFENIKKGMPDYVTYKGVAQFDMSVQILQEYFLLLFPTKFYTEGIPGTIIDAYAAGVPVISSKWESFEDVVNDGITGFGYEFGNVNEFLDIMDLISRDPKTVMPLKRNCIQKAHEYTLKSFIKQFDF